MEYITKLGISNPISKKIIISISSFDWSLCSFDFTYASTKIVE